MLCVEYRFPLLIKLKVKIQISHWVLAEPRLVRVVYSAVWRGESGKWFVLISISKSKMNGSLTQIFKTDDTVTRINRSELVSICHLPRLHHSWTLTVQLLCRRVIEYDFHSGYNSEQFKGDLLNRWPLDITVRHIYTPCGTLLRTDLFLSSYEMLCYIFKQYF